jgi:hypothetical protein
MALLWLADEDETASAAVSNPAQAHSAQLRRWWQSLALNGNAKRSDDTSSGWTSSKEP